MIDTTTLSRACTQAWEAYALTGDPQYRAEWDKLRRRIWSIQDAD